VPDRSSDTYKTSHISSQYPNIREVLQHQIDPMGFKKISFSKSLESSGVTKRWHSFYLHTVRGTHREDPWAQKTHSCVFFPLAYEGFGGLVSYNQTDRGTQDSPWDANGPTWRRYTVGLSLLPNFNRANQIWKFMGTGATYNRSADCWNT